MPIASPNAVPNERWQRRPSEERAQTSSRPSPLTSARRIVDQVAIASQPSASDHSGPGTRVGKLAPSESQHSKPSAVRAQRSARRSPSMSPVRIVP